MALHYKLLKESHYKTTKWDGGSTTELAIYPHFSSYQARNFAWRLSSAKVQQNETVFTHLPGYKRVLMVLEGALVLAHERQHIANLAAYGKDRFDGGWTTHCIGVGRDFNLMLGEGCDGDVDIIANNDIHHILPATGSGPRFTAFYCADAETAPKAVLQIGGKQRHITLKPHQLLLIENTLDGHPAEDASLQFITPAASAQFHVVRAEIACKG